MKQNTILIALGLLLAIDAFAGPPATPGAQVEELLAIARSQNPELAAMGYESEAAAARVQPAGALPDPVARLELRDLTNKDTDAGPSLSPSRVGSTKYTLLQTFPLWGKRDLKREAAEADAAQAKARESGAWAELAAKIKIAYAQYYFAAKSRQLTEELLDLSGSMEQLALARYADGLVPQQDVVRAQVERTVMRTELLAIETAHHHAVARLNGLLRRPPMAALAVPQALRPLPSAEKLDYATLEARLLAANPTLLAQGAQATAADSNRELVQRNRYPDLTVGLSPIQMRNRVNEWELMFEVNIPLQQESRRSQEREAAAMASAARARREGTQSMFAADLAENLAGLDTARRTEALVATSLQPQAELSFNAALAGYETGKLGLAPLLEAQQQVRKAKIERLKAQVEAQTRLADIERLLGEEL